MSAVWARPRHLRRIMREIDWIARRLEIVIQLLRHYEVFVTPKKKEKKSYATMEELELAARRP